MKGMMNKLKDCRGVSILYGIMFLLVATMVAGVILSAAVSSVQRVHAEQERNQNTLTLRSAGDFVRDCIAGTTCDIVTETTTGTNETTIKSVKAEGPLKNELEPAVAKACGLADPRQDPKDYTGDFDVKVGSDAPDALKNGEVKVDFTMDKARASGAEDAENSYRIVATVALEDSSQRLFLVAYQSVPPTPEVISESTDSKVTKSTVKWDAVSLGTNNPNNKSKSGETS